MKKFKLVFSIVLAIMMVISIVPMTASATTSGTCGENLTWSFDESTGTLTISGTGAMYNYEQNNCPWRKYECNIKEIVIDDSVTSIGNWAFYSCESLTSVIIGNSVQTIGELSFFVCNSLTSVIIPNSVKTIGYGAFYGCSNLTSITVDSDNQYYSNDEYDILFNKNKTTLIQYPVGSTRTSYTIPDSVTTIGELSFASCNNLTSVTIPDSVTIIGNRAFDSCDNLTNITIGNNVTTVGMEAFYYCRSLKSVTIPNSVTTIDGGAFEGCNSLTSVIIGDSVTTIGSYAFSNCSRLTTVTLPNTVTEIGCGTFYSCNNLANISIPNSIILINDNAFCYCINLTDVYYCGTEEQWNAIDIGNNNDYLFNATLHYHNFVDGICSICGEKGLVSQAMSSQIRFDRNDDESYAGTFDVRTRAMISDGDFTEFVGATNEEAIDNIDKVGFVYTVDGENFSAASAQAVAQGGTASGYVDAPVKYIQDADGYYMFTCLVTDIPDTDKDYTLTAYAYICVNGKWYFSEAPMNADFNNLYTTYYPIACEKYGWEV